MLIPDIGSESGNFKPGCRLAVGLPHDPLLVDIPLPLLDRGALVVGLLARGKRDLAFDQVGLPVHPGADAGLSLLLGRGKKAGQLLLVQQQATGAGGVGNDMGAGRDQGCDV